MNKHVNTPAVQYAVVLKALESTESPSFVFVVREFEPDVTPGPFEIFKNCKAVFAERSAALEYAGYLQWRFYTKY